MLKVLIADDERLIREGVVVAIDWEALEMELVGAAVNGREALELATELRPDICLVDIMMPIVSGLEFIERLKKELPEVICIIVTGYDEFDYARRAMQLDAFEYILKPINEEEFKETLLRAKNRILNRESLENKVNQMELQLEKTLPDAFGRFVKDCMNGKCSDADTDAFARMYNIQLGLNIGMFVVRLSDGVFVGRRDEARLASALGFALRQMLEETMARYYDVLKVVSDEKDRIIAVADISLGSVFEDVRIEAERSIRSGLEFSVPIYAAITDKGLNNIDSLYRSICLKQEHESQYTPLVKKAKDYMDANYCDEELTLKRIADEFCVSTGHISRLIKSEMGISYSDYITEKRISRAVAMLNEGELKIYEISDKIGYNSQHYFCTTFKRVTGLSPTDFKNKRSQRKEPQ